MKAVMISIRPEWVAKILSGEKTREVRKSAPKLETPFRCYIYETQGKTDTPWIDEEGHMIFRGRGQVVAEFICDRIVTMSASYKNIERANRGFSFYEETRLSDRQIIDYLGNGVIGYGWCISKLKIYDKPKQVTDFSVIRNIPVEYAYGTARQRYTLERPPQSWCYVEDLR